MSFLFAFLYQCFVGLGCWVNSIRLTLTRFLYGTTATASISCLYLSIFHLYKNRVRVCQILHLFQRAMFVCRPPCPPVDFNVIYKTWTLQPYKIQMEHTHTHTKKSLQLLNFFYFCFLFILLRVYVRVNLNFYFLNTIDCLNYKNEECFVHTLQGYHGSSNLRPLFCTNWCSFFIGLDLFGKSWYYFHLSINIQPNLILITLLCTFVYFSRHD